MICVQSQPHETRISPTMQEKDSLKFPSAILLGPRFLDFKMTFG